MRVVDAVRARVLMLILLLAAPAGLQAASIRFVHDQTVGMPVTQVSGTDGEMRITGGLLSELEAAVARELGFEAVQLATPRKRVEQLLENGRGDVLCFYDPVWLDHADHYSWTGPVIANRNLLVSRRDVPLPAQLTDLQQGRIGTVQGYVYPELEALGQRPKLLRDDAPDDESNIRKLVGGRTDFVITHQLFLDYELRIHPDLAAKLGGRLVIRSFDTRCAVSRSAPVTAAQIDAAIAALRHRGEYDAILSRYR